MRPFSSRVKSTNHNRCSKIINHLSWVYTKRFICEENPGTPQGSKLSNFFFLMLVNSVVKVVKHSHITLFADDMKIMHKIESINDCHKLQSDLDSICCWANELGLKFNVQKCEQMTYSHKRNNISFNYTINNSHLQIIDQKKDLGIKFTPNMSFNTHVENCISSCNKILGLIKRSCKHQTALLQLYQGLVRSKLEYGAVLWDPENNLWTHKIEAVQYRFVKYLFHKENGFYPVYPEHISYLEMCEALQLLTLRSRRKIQKMIHLYKLTKGSVDSFHLFDEMTKNILPMDLHHYSTRHSKKQYFKKSSSKYTSPLDKMCDEYNQHYNDECNLSSPFQTFLKHLKDKFMSEQYTQGW
uniref:Reverse transcriptase domain-containing protein n=1 Tax=Cacopsylla melanoneura TaxID=428564 RepID=A0A8D8R7I8_9HEMI